MWSVVSVEFDTLKLLEYGSFETKTEAEECLHFVLEDFRLDLQDGALIQELSNGRGAWSGKRFILSNTTLASHRLDLRIVALILKEQ